MMAYVALADAVLAVCLGLWARTLSRARGGDVPCTARLFSGAMVAVGVAAIVALVVANVLVLSALDDAFGKKLSPVVFTAWLLAMSAAGILFIFAVNTLHTNRTAAAWLRVVPPDELILRAGGHTRTLKLGPGAVRVLGIVEVAGGLMYIQYLVHDVELVVRFMGGAAVDGAPRLDRPRGLVVQGAARRLHRHFAPFRG
jgi:hypothetical protein